MDNKYYIPTIDEFHVGFEYEYQDDNKVWSTSEITLLDTKISTLVGIYNKDFATRVKYLDKDDIESLGWKYYNIKGDYLKYRLGRFELWYPVNYPQPNIKEDGTIELIEQPIASREFVILDIKYGNDITKVDGIRLNNKSELKVLMKQLNIKI